MNLPNQSDPSESTPASLKGDSKQNQSIAHHLRLDQPNCQRAEHRPRSTLPRRERPKLPRESFGPSPTRSVETKPSPKPARTNHSPRNHRQGCNSNRISRRASFPQATRAMLAGFSVRSRVFFQNSQKTLVGSRSPMRSIRAFDVTDWKPRGTCGILAGVKRE